jgi:hypothetical protein
MGCLPQLDYSAMYRNILKSSRHSLVSATYGQPLIFLACPLASKYEVNCRVVMRTETLSRLEPFEAVARIAYHRVGEFVEIGDLTAKHRSELIQTY